MEALREQFDSPLMVGIASFVAGLLIGLFVLGWWLWPVRWTDAAPEHLRTEFKGIYLRMAIDSYSVNPDPAIAQQRIAEVGAEADQVLSSILADPGNQNPEAIQVFASLAGVEPVVVDTPEATPVAGTPGRVARILLPIMCLITFLLAGGLVAAYLLRDRLPRVRLPTTRRQTAARQAPEAEAEYAQVGAEPPLANFITTYNVGDDNYSTFFSIDSPTGDSVGECGVAISETIGVGDPKKVTAFEVWLFDSKDFKSVTQVLMSEHAFADESIRQRLETKGDLLVASPGQELVLETTYLQLVVRVVDMSYGTGGTPPDSFFKHLTLELVIWSKA